MAQCTFFNADGFLVQSTQSVNDCTGHILVSPTEYNLMVQSVEIDPSEVSAVFGITFGWVVLLGALSYKIKVAKRTVSKA